MAANLLTLARRLRKAASKRPDATVNVVSNEKAKAVALTFLREVVNHTPVDTTLAASNWMVSLGVMPSLATHSIRLAYVYGSGGSTAEASRAAAIAAGAEVIAKKLPGQPLYVYNVIPYIRRLDAGWSSQEPAGFVARARLIASKVA